MYGMTPIGVFFLAVFPPRPPNQGFCQQLHIWDKADELGLSCTVEVTVAVGESGIPLPDTAVITGPYSGELAALIQEEVGIPAEKQIWREESVWSEAAESG